MNYFTFWTLIAEFNITFELAGNSANNLITWKLKNYKKEFLFVANGLKYN